MQPNPLNNFSTNYKQVLIKSINLALEQKDKEVKPEHLLYCLTKQKGCIGSKILNKANFKIKQNNNKLKKKIPDNKKNILPAFNNNTVTIIEKSASLALKYQHPYIATEHLLLALLESSDNNLKKIFNEKRLDYQYIKNQLQIIFDSTAKFSNFTEPFNYPEMPPEANFDPTTELYSNTKQASALKSFTTDLTDSKIQKKIDPVIGRDNEITRLIEILMRRTKNNPLILGDPGVGKTAIVEGLAKKIHDKQVPEILANKKIMAIDLTVLVAGTMFRGEFENRMKMILEEIKKNPNIIVFIDEIHNIIGAGSTQGSMDVANILKPALARGEIRCIGATTYEEYKKHLINDAALDRRFQLLKINEPTATQTIEIIRGIKNNYEKYHQINISDKAVKTAVDLSQKYLTDRFFPDKAIDLIDEASAKAKIKNNNNLNQTNLTKLYTDLDKTKKDKEKAIIQENFKKAILLKIKEKELSEQINNLNKKLGTKKTKQPTIKSKEICEVVAKITDLPLGDILMTDKKRYLNLEKYLKKHIVGQDHALTALSQAIRRAKAGLTEHEKPLGSFIFIGPSGTGKTYTAKILNKVLFDNPANLVKIDMSEFSEKFNISKLIGAPAGYVGYKESGKLTDAVKRNPNAIVLFDEIEKAHPDIFNLLLQILDEGYITDASGKKTDFKNTLIIMTSNLGNNKINKSIGFDKNNTEQNKQILEKEIKNHFNPELINRLDKIITFNTLNKKNLLQIIRLELKNLQKHLTKQGINLQIDKQVSNYILETDFKEEKGARFIKQNIEELITNQLSEKFFRQINNQNYHLTIKNKQIIISNG